LEGSASFSAQGKKQGFGRGKNVTGMPEGGCRDRLKNKYGRVFRAGRIKEDYLRGEFFGTERRGGRTK